MARPIARPLFVSFIAGSLLLSSAVLAQNIIRAPMPSGGPSSNSFQPTQPNLALSPLVHNFGAQALRELSPPVTLTLTNRMDDAVLVERMSLTGAATSFVLDAAECETELQPGQSCDIQVRFSPQTAGLKTAQVNVYDADGNRYQVGLLEGTGAVGSLVVSEAQVDFTDLRKGQAQTKTITITNAGAGPAYIQSFSYSGDPALSFNSGCSDLQPQQSCTIAVTALVTDDTTKRGTLTVLSSNTLTQTLRIQVSAAAASEPPPPAGGPELVLSTHSLNFGNVATNTTEKRQVLVTNPGTGTLNFTAAPTVTGASAFGSGLTNCSATLAAGEGCLVEVSFSPTEVGSFSGSLSISASVPNSPQHVALAGTAFNPVSLAAATLPVGKVGQPYTFDFKTLLNVSNETTPNKSLATWTGSGSLPAGLSFNPTTGVLSGTPTATHPGASYTVTGTYKNNQGQQVYTIAVNGATLEAVQISPGATHTCAVTTAGAAVCWGDSRHGELGIHPLYYHPTPGQVFGLSSGVASISAGRYYTCAVTTAGAALCWGDNSFGQLGDNTLSARSTPTPVFGLSSGVKKIVAGFYHTCALTTSGGVLCWGRNADGQLGNGTISSFSATPVPVVGLSSGVADISLNINHTCAVTTTGAALCWGDNSVGQLGDGTQTDRLTPTPVAGLSSGVVSVKAGQSLTCALTTAGAVLCWGYNYDGVLGDGTQTDRLTPTPVAGLSSGVVSIDAGLSHTCALTTAGAVLCWGYNYAGQLGDGTTTNRSTPTSVVGLPSGVVSISTGFYHTCALTSAGTAWCWGFNDYSQIGDGTRSAYRLSPVLVSN
jgi:alpha-tubulin suppressor-like RCC1 family protein